MHECYCPECGQKIDSFCLSLVGLFDPIGAGENNPYTEFAFHQKNVLVDFEKLRKNSEYTIFKNGIQSEISSIKDERGALLRNYAAIDLDNEENQDIYIWVRYLIHLIQEAREMQLVQYLLRVDENKINSQNLWFSTIDLKDCFSKEKTDKAMRQLTPLFGHNTQPLNIMGERVERIRNFLDTASRCVMRCDPNWVARDNNGRFGTWKSVQGKNEQLLSDFNYGGQSAYCRICSHCGAHISADLGFYPQRIFSFIGTPASGKSNLICSIYRTVYNMSQEGILSSTFNQYSPHYQYYENARNRLEKKYAVKKTDIGEYPSLTICLKRNGDESSACVFTFVDVPGEYFIDNENANIFVHSQIMRKSEAIYVVIGGDMKGMANHNIDEVLDQALVTGGDFTTFIARCQNFRANVLGNEAIRMELVVTKADMVRPEDGDYVEQNGETIWRPTLRGTHMLKTDIDEMYALLKSTQEDGYKFNENMVDVEKLIQTRDLIHHFLNGDKNQTGQFIDIFNALQAGAFREVDGEIKFVPSNEWNRTNFTEKVAVHMISAFGFYAIESADKMSFEEKKQAVEHYTADSEECKKLMELVNKEREVMLESQDSRLMHKVYDDYYQYIHIGDVPMGVRLLMYRLLLRTHVLNSQLNQDFLKCYAKQLEKRKELNNAKKSLEKTWCISIRKKRRLREEIEELEFAVKKYESEIKKRREEQYI